VKVAFVRTQACSRPSDRHRGARGRNWAGQANRARGPPSLSDRHCRLRSSPAAAVHCARGRDRRQHPGRTPTTADVAGPRPSPPRWSATCDTGADTGCPPLCPGPTATEFGGVVSAALTARVNDARERCSGWPPSRTGVAPPPCHLPHLQIRNALGWLHRALVWAARATVSSRLR
jgi:hypothetical protein